MIFRTMVVDSSELPPARPARRSAPLKNTLPARRGVSSRKFEPSRSVSSTPSGPPSRSPAGVETSTTSSNLNAKLDGLRIPLIHLLALGSASEHSLATKTKATEEMCLRILQRIANRVKAGRQWELMDDHFKDLDVWGFPYEEGDRNTAVFNCRAAFNRLRLPREAPEWQTLLQPEDRGKVDPNPLPVKSSKTVASDVPSLSLHIPLDIKMPSEGAQTPGSKGTKKKDTKDPISHIIKKKGKKVTAPGKPKGPTGRQPKPLQKQSVSNPKIKSAEKVLDSDEDVEMEDVKLSPPKLEHAPVSPGHPIACSKTSYIVNSDAELDKKAHNAKISTKKKPRYLPTPKPNSYVKVPSKEACRRSVSVSPPKPSPLGSSPPINASDVEEQSNVPSPRVPTPYAGNSTASQSPSDSLAGIIRTTKSSKNGVKRKVTVVREPDELSDYRSSVSSTASNKRQNTGSPDDATLLLARQFKEEFREYERLYNEARATEDSLRKQERIENVLKIHRDLERLKAAVQARTPVHVR